MGLESVKVAQPSPDSIQVFLLSAVPPSHHCGSLSHDDFSCNRCLDEMLHAHVICKLEKLGFGSNSGLPNVSHSGIRLERRQPLWGILFQGTEHAHSKLFKDKT